MKLLSTSRDSPVESHCHMAHNSLIFKRVKFIIAVSTALVVDDVTSDVSI
jgi:hypothetical protein